MKCIATYPSYQEANERQLDLLAADIDALVQYVPNGVEQVYLGALPIYALIVAEEQADSALEIIGLVGDENYQSLLRCPVCDSSDVKERSLSEGFGGGPFSFIFTLGLIGVGRMLLLRLRGRKYVCRTCGAPYRKKP